MTPGLRPLDDPPMLRWPRKTIGARSRTTTMRDQQERELKDGGKGGQGTSPPGGDNGVQHDPTEIELWTTTLLTTRGKGDGGKQMLNNHVQPTNPRIEAHLLDQALRERGNHQLIGIGVRRTRPFPQG